MFESELIRTIAEAIGVKDITEATDITRKLAAAGIIPKPESDPSIGDLAAMHLIEIAHDRNIVCVNGFHRRWDIHKSDPHMDCIPIIEDIHAHFQRYIDLIGEQFASDVCNAIFRVMQANGQHSTPLADVLQYKVQEMAERFKRSKRRVNVD